MENGKKSSDMTRSKDELLRAFINPANKNGADSSKLNTLTGDENGSAAQDSIGLKGRIQSRSQGKGGAGLNEVGGFQGATLDKIQAKASKMKDGSDEKTGLKGTLS